MAQTENCKKMHAKQLAACKARKMFERQSAIKIEISINEISKIIR